MNLLPSQLNLKQRFWLIVNNLRNQLPESIPKICSREYGGMGLEKQLQTKSALNKPVDSNW